MAQNKIRVGIIGANPDRGWAMTAHIPALKSLPDYELTAVSTSNAESAARAGEKFGVKHAFGDYRQLVEHPDVDLVVVAVQVGTHLELAGAALDAGKHVYCEWPLGRTLAEAEELSARAAKAGVLAVVGLQSRFNPGVLQVKRLVEEGKIGRVLSSSVIASGMGWGPATPLSNLYANDADGGATMLRIPAGHFLEGFAQALGEFHSVTSRMEVLYPEAMVLETKEMAPKTSADQITIAGLFGDAQSPGVASIHYRGGLSRATNFHWEINGTQGDIVVTGPNGHLQMVPLSIAMAVGKEAMAPVEISDEFRWAPAATPAGPAYNVAQSYVLLAEDLKSGTSRLATFGDALKRHQLIDAIERSAKTGAKQTLG